MGMGVDNARCQEFTGPVDDRRPRRCGEPCADGADLAALDQHIGSVEHRLDAVEHRRIADECHA